MSESAAMPEDLDGGGLRIGIAVSTFNETVTNGLLAGAQESLASSGVTDVVVVRVPGAFELPLIAQRLARSGCDAVIALGAVIMGGTDHYDHVAHRCSEGLMRVSLDEGIPVTFGVLTTRKASAAIERSRPGPGNKGVEAAEAAVMAANLVRRIG